MSCFPASLADAPDLMFFKCLGAFHFLILIELGTKCIYWLGVHNLIDHSDLIGLVWRVEKAVQNLFNSSFLKVSEYDQEMTKSRTADQPTSPQGRDTEHRQPQHKVK